MVADILVPLTAVGLAELGDKTQLAVLCLSSKTKRHIELLLGIILAFVIADGLAITLGNYVTSYIPIQYLKTLSGITFILFGIFTLMNSKKVEAQCEMKQPFSSAFLLILISEMGDKTQIAAGLFATKYNPVLVFIGVIFALTVLSVMTIYLGKFIALKLNKRVISTVSGILFVLIGISFFL